MKKTIQKICVAIAIAMAASAPAHAAESVYSCSLEAVNPQQASNSAFNFNLYINDNGSARIEGIKNRDVRARQNNRKVRANWKTGILRMAATIDRASGQTNANAKADGYTGSLRWQGTCKAL